MLPDRSVPALRAPPLLQLLLFVMLKVVKFLIYTSVFIFSTIGAYIPALWHASLFSVSSIIGGILGTVVGIWAAIKVNNYVEL